MLGVSQETLKESRYIGDDDFLLPPKNVLSKNKHDLKEIRHKHPGYNKPQEAKLHHKKSKSGKGSGCNNIFTAGTLCLKVEGTS